ncbi:MAG: TIGR00266 family protein [Halobaculum sp.]|jgi:uncharacterized protein (TIGR00266 family)
MEFTVENDPASAVLTVELASGESVRADPGSFLSRTAAVESDTSGGGGGVTGMIGKALSDEREVLETTFTATGGAGRVTLAPDEPGDLTRLDIDDLGAVKVQSGGILAWTPDVQKQTTANEAGNLFSSGELTVLRLSGSGTAFLAAFGGIRSERVQPTDPLTVDEDHLLAWTDGLDVSRTKDSSIKSTLLGGEGFVTRFDGDGRVWLQTRDPSLLRQPSA